MVKVYESIYKIPVWNWEKMNKESNMDYLLILDNYNNVPEHNINLGKVYFDLIEQLPSAEVEIQTTWLKYHKQHILYRYKKNNNIGLVYQLLNNYITELDKVFKNYRYNDKVFKNAKELYQYIRQNSKGKDELLSNQFDAFFIALIDAEPKHKSDMVTQLTELSLFFKVDYNAHTTSVGQYYDMLHIYNKRNEPKRKK